jgi:hypothetical protein
VFVSYERIGAEGGSRTRTGLPPTDFKSASGVFTEFYYALPSRIYRRFSRQSKLRPAWYRHVTPHLPLNLIVITRHQKSIGNNHSARVVRRARHRSNEP